MTKNVNQHSKTNHIEIRYHFLRDHYEKGDIEIDYVFTDFQLAVIFTKPLHYDRFLFICGELNVCVMNSWGLKLLHICFIWFHIFSIDIHVFLLVSLLVSCVFILCNLLLFFAWQKGREVFELWYLSYDMFFRYLVVEFLSFLLWCVSCFGISWTLCISIFITMLIAMPWFIVFIHCIIFLKEGGMEGW